MQKPPMVPIQSGGQVDLAGDDEKGYEDVEYDVSDKIPDSDEKNSALAVGYKSDRSFVVRGDKIGVFKHTNKDQLGTLTQGEPDPH